MATRKALVLVSGLFQELNSSSDKLDFAGNSTTDLSEGSNQYFTTSRARGSVSVTDSGGDGSLAYNSTSGVITYTGPLLLKLEHILVLHLDLDYLTTQVLESLEHLQYQIVNLLMMT